MDPQNRRAASGVLSSFSTAILAAAAVSCSSPASIGNTDPASVIALETGMWEQWKQGQYDAMGARMTPDVLIADDVAGLADRAGLLGAMKGSGCTPESYALRNPTVRLLAPDVALIAYDVTPVMLCAGQRTTSAQVATSVWVRRDTTWLTAAHHQNSVPAHDTLGKTTSR